MNQRLLFSLGTLAGAGLATLVLQTDVLPSAAAAPSEMYRQLGLLGDVFDRVRTGYVEPPNEAKLIEGAISGMLTSLDPHSSYMSPKEFKEMQTETHGEFGGIGTEVTMEEGLIKVIAPIDDTPAARAGILANDIITQINGEPVQSLTLNQAVDKIRGPVNSSVKLTIRRKDKKEPIEVKLTRETIHIRPVRARTEGGDIGYLRMTSSMSRPTRLCAPGSRPLPGSRFGQAQGLRHRSAQQSGRSARSGDHCLGRFPDQRRDRLHPGPQPRGDTTLCRQGQGKGSGWGQAAGGAHQWRLGLRLRDRGRGAAGPQARHRAGHALVRQGLGPDRHSAGQQGRAALDHGALLHPVRPLDPGQGHRAGSGGAAGRARRAQGPGRDQG